MWAKDRHHLILALLKVNKHLSLDRLVEETKASRETLRRDIVQLEADGKLQRVHGGIVRPEGPEEPPLKSRLKSHIDEKRRIGIAAARLIEPGMMCAIDAGSTTSAFAAALAKVPGVSIVTNSVDVAMTLRAAQREAEIILLGGRFGPDVPGTYGVLTTNEMRRFSPQVAVFSPVAISPTRGASNFHLAEAEFARALIERAERVVLLADHSKMNTIARVHVCDCDRIDVLVTDRKTSDGVLAQFRDHGVRETLVG
jgi:DeoR family transcriptional regulator, fructose operon transcriptional repressor